MGISSFDYRVAINLDETVERRPKNIQDNGKPSSHNDDLKISRSRPRNSFNHYHQHISILRAIGSPYDLRIAGTAFAGVQ